MPTVIYQSQPIPRIQNQATRVLPGHGTGVQGEALNDGHYRFGRFAGVAAVVKRVLSVLANVIGGSLMILGMLMLPHIIDSLV